VEEFVTAVAQTPFGAREAFLGCGLIVDATVQYGCRAVGPFHDARTHYSGTHHLYCLKSQAIPDRQGMAVLMTAGVPDAMHDMAVFRAHVPEVERLLQQHPGEPVHMLADAR
jgi:hypothetical protein